MSELGLRVNPYVGLRPFFSDDSLYFFGRGQQTTELLEILHQQRFLGVVGSSGSGKSSLVHAGLLPKLLGGFLVQDRDRWRIVTMKPGDAPLANLAAALLDAMGETPTPEARVELEQAIRDGHTDAVVGFLTPRLEKNANVFLLVDQFEEIFAFRGSEEEDGPKQLNPTRRKERARRKAEAADFVNLVLALVERRELPIYVALTMRTDFLGDCDLFYGLPEALNRGRYLVPRMTRQQLREAIEGPAMLMRARIAPRLLDQVLNELGDRFDRLPVLQHALLRTWDAWRHAGSVGPIDLQHYSTAGGLERALDQDAEGALQGLDLGITARVCKRLTDTDPKKRRVRSPARISELGAVAGVDQNTVRRIVRRLEEDGRSFVHSSEDGRPDDPRVDISHESLIRQWDRLRNWVDEERRSRDQYIELVARARKRERGEAALLLDPELQIVLDWREEEAPSPAWAERYSVADGDFDGAMAYLDQSLEVRCRERAERELQRRWRRVWNPLILLALLLAAAFTTKEYSGVEFEWRAGETPASVAAGGTTAKPTTPAVVSRSTGRLEDLWKAVSSTSKKFWYLGLFLLAYIGLAEGGRRIHQGIAFPVILRGLSSSGGQNRPEDKVKAAKLQDAVVAHHTTYASTFRRVAGYLIDMALYLPLATVATAITTLDLAPDGSPSDASMLAWLAVCILMGWLYEALQIASRRQATVGMRAVRIFRTDLYGERLSFARASAWYGYRLLSYLGFGLGFFLQPFTKKRQTFHDRMAGSVVLRRPPPDVAAG